MDHEALEICIASVGNIMISTVLRSLRFDRLPEILRTTYHRGGRYTASPGCQGHGADRLWHSRLGAAKGPCQISPRIQANQAFLRLRQGPHPLDITCSSLS